MKVLSTVSAAFLLLFILFFSLGRTANSGIRKDGVVPTEEKIWTPDELGAQIWPLGALLLAMVYVRQQLYNTRAIALVFIAGITLLCLYTLSDSRQAFKGVMAIAIAIYIASYAPPGLEMNIAIPMIFTLVGLAFLALYWESQAYLDTMLSLAIVGSAIVLTRPKSFADSAAIFVASLVLVS